MFTWFALVCFFFAMAYVWMKRNESFFVKLACGLVFGAGAYVVALGLGLILAEHLPSKWLVEHEELASLYQDGERVVFLETVFSDGKPYLHFKRNGKNDSEFVPKDGNTTVQAEGALMVLRIHKKEFVPWWSDLLAMVVVSAKPFVDEPSKYEFIVPKDKRKNVSDN